MTNGIERAMKLSREGILKAIRSNLSMEDAATEIWAAVEEHIVESENRIIDAEFALQEIKSSEKSATTDCP